MHGIFGDLLGSLTGFFDESGIAIVGGVGVFITILALGRAFVAHDPMAARLKSHQERRQHLLQEILTGDKQHKAAKQASVNLMRQLVEKLKLTRGDDARKTVDKLAQAGWRSRDQLILFLGYPTGAAVRRRWRRAALLGLCRQRDLDDEHAPGGRWRRAVRRILACRLSPHAISKRYQKLRRQLPDGLDLLVICAEAGLSLDAALTPRRPASSAAPPRSSPTSSGLTSIELGLSAQPPPGAPQPGPARRPAPFRAVINTLMQTERYGTPLAPLAPRAGERVPRRAHECGRKRKRRACRRS